jgi:hypothetical protein
VGCKKKKRKYADGGVAGEALANISEKNRVSNPLDLLTMGAKGFGEAYTGLTDPVVMAGKQAVVDPLVERAYLGAMPEKSKKEAKDEAAILSTVLSQAAFDPANLAGLGAASKVPKMAAALKPKRKALENVRHFLKQLPDDEVARRQAEFIKSRQGLVDEINPGQLYQMQKQSPPSGYGYTPDEYLEMRKALENRPTDLVDEATVVIPKKAK